MPAPIARITNSRKGVRKGEPLRFVHGHNNRGVTGERASQWKGGRSTDHRGYIVVTIPDDHPFASMRAHGKYSVREHRLVMAEMIGRPLRAEEVVHHVNEVKDDNRPENLMLFANNSEHLRYHAFLRKLARGDPTPTCGHRHPYPQGRAECERRLAAAR